MKAFARINLFLLLGVVALAVMPIAFGLGKGKDEPFAGADALAENQIVTDHPDYHPWFSSLYEPPSGEVESGLFALQAALGAGFIGYYFGVSRTRRRLDIAKNTVTPATTPSQTTVTGDVG